MFPSTLLLSKHQSPGQRELDFQLCIANGLFRPLLNCQQPEVVCPWLSHSVSRFPCHSFWLRPIWLKVNTIGWKLSLTKKQTGTNCQCFRVKLGDDGQVWMSREEWEQQWVVEANAQTSRHHWLILLRFASGEITFHLHCQCFSPQRTIFHWSCMAQLWMHYNLHIDAWKE